MKKEYYILLALIIALAAYLSLKKDDQVHYNLPVLAEVDASKIDKIEITKAKSSMVLSKTDQAWTLTDKKLPADPQGMKKILETITGLTLSALVSEAGDPVRYELDEPNAIEIKAFEGNALKQSFFIGKTAPSLNHTFVMLHKGKQIFQADNNFRNTFDKSVDELRDKLVLEFIAKEIKTITLEKQGVTKVLVLKPKNEAKDTPEQEPTPVWQFGDGSQTDHTAASDLLSSLSHLECETFLEPKAALDLKKNKVLCKITLENGDSLGLTLFELTDGETMAGKSILSPYAFTLAPYKAKDIVSYVDKLLGLEKPEEKTPDKD